MAYTLARRFFDRFPGVVRSRAGHWLLWQFVRLDMAGKAVKS